MPGTLHEPDLALERRLAEFERGHARRPLA
jgi:hypothetical protein